MRRGRAKTVEAIERLREDVLESRPDVVSVCFGMNDAGYTEFEEEWYETLMAGMTVLLSELKRVKATGGRGGG